MSLGQQSFFIPFLHTSKSGGSEGRLQNKNGNKYTITRTNPGYSSSGLYCLFRTTYVIAILCSGCERGGRKAWRLRVGITILRTSPNTTLWSLGCTMGTKRSRRRDSNKSASNLKEAMVSCCKFWCQRGLYILLSVASHARRYYGHILCQIATSVKEAEVRD